MTRVGRPKKWEWKIIPRTYTFYQKDIDNVQELRDIWKICKVDVIRKAIITCLEQEKEKLSKEK